MTRRPINNGTELARQVKAMALDVGFDLAGIADVAPSEKSNRVYRRWLDDGNHAEMSYLERHRERREDAQLLFPGARSAICVAVNYYHEIEKDQRRLDGSDGHGAFSIYVHHEDYHAVLDRMLAELAQRLQERFPTIETYPCVDIRAISDRAMAARAGIAWIGKNTCAISPEFGSWVFIGELLTTLELTPDAPLETLCGRCTRCIDACPTGALDTPFVLDARKCISFLTIEKRGEIPAGKHESIGLDVYGCDTCQSVCPYNDIATESAVFSRSDRSPLVDLSLDELIALDDEAFRDATHNSAIRRCKSEGMRRNALIVKDNLSDGPIAQPSALSSD